VREIMTTPVETIDADATVEDVRARFRQGGHGAYPIVDGNGQMVAIIARGDVLDVEPGTPGSVLDHASPDVVCVSPDDVVLAALNVMIDESVEHVPVLDDGRLVGICTRTDLLKVRRDQRELEQQQTGFHLGQVRARLQRRRPQVTR
jgi:CBS domain-containing protein